MNLEHKCSSIRSSSSKVKKKKERQREVATASAIPKVTYAIDKANLFLVQDFFYMLNFEENKWNFTGLKTNWSLDV